MTVKEALTEIRGIAGNMWIDYIEHYNDSKSAEQIIEDLEKTIREFHEIISKMKSMAGMSGAKVLYRIAEEISKENNNNG